MTLMQLINTDQISENPLNQCHQRFIVLKPFFHQLHYFNSCFRNFCVWTNPNLRGLINIKFPYFNLLILIHSLKNGSSISYPVLDFTKNPFSTKRLRLLKTVLDAPVSFILENSSDKGELSEFDIPIRIFISVLLIVFHSRS